MKKAFVVLLAGIAMFAVVLRVCTAQAGSPMEILLAENDGLKAVMRLQSPATLGDTDWLQLEIANTGPAGRIKEMRLEGPSYQEGRLRTDVLSGVALGLPTGVNPAVSIGHTIPEGRYVTSSPGIFAGEIYGVPKADVGFTILVRLTLELEDGRSLDMAEPRTLAFRWARPTGSQVEAMQAEAVNLVSKRMSSPSVFSPEEAARFRVLLKTEETARAVTREQALGALLRRQLYGENSLTDDRLLALVFNRWRTDLAVIEFYREALEVRGPQALSDLARFGVTLWDDSFVEPVVRLVEAAALTLVNDMTLVHGIEFLHRNYASWSSKTWAPPRLSRALIEIHSAMKGQSGSPGTFYRFADLLAKTHDRGMIGVLRPYLTDKTIDPFTSQSSTTLRGFTPMRYSELAANAIARLLGEPDVVENRARAPDHGPYPEWSEWDQRIAAFQQRLDAMPKR
jgi:hypothetical protein